jgi:hypothetical protein
MCGFLNDKLGIDFAERWHQRIKNCVLLENYYLPADLEYQIGALVHCYNAHRYHESLDNLTPLDVYLGQGAKILEMRAHIKKQTIQKRLLVISKASRTTAYLKNQSLCREKVQAFRKTLTTDR